MVVKSVSRQDVVEIFKKYRLQSIDLPLVEKECVSDAIEEILALYPSPPDLVSVGKEEILQAICRYSDHILGKKAQGFMADDLLALLSGQGRKQEPWCEHMEQGWMKENPWKFCPYCGVKRPARV